jgi:prefoldin alpha subunit
LSSGEKEVRVLVPLEAVISEFERTKRYVEGLQENIRRALERLNDLAIARDLISSMKVYKVNEILVPANKEGSVYAYAKLDRVDRVVVHIGQDYFLELSLEKAMEVIVSEENEIKEVIKELEKELSEATKYLQTLQAVILSASRGAQPRGEQRSA